MRFGFLLIFATVLSSAHASANEDIAVEHIKPKTPQAQAKKAAPSKLDVKLPTLLKEVEAKYFKASTLVADFNETNESAALKQVKKSSGKIEFKRPGKIRWETLKPDKNLLISDGKKFWFYTPPFDPEDPGQYWEKPADKVQSRFAQSLLSGTFSYNASKQAIMVKQLSKTDFAVFPKKGTGGGVKQATLHVDPVKKLITGVDLLHQGGNKTTITLSGIRLGETLDDKIFQFAPPPNTELMKEE